jgi:ABC-type nitrate/sulfonate/bicarbonate transport system permease component
MSFKVKNISGIFVCAFSILAWELLTKYHLINHFILPAPHKIFESFLAIVSSKELFIHIFASFIRVGMGFFLSVSIGIPLGMLLYEFKILHSIFSPMLSFIKPIPPIAWMPLSLLFFGLGNAPAIFLTFISSFGPLVFSTYWALEEISEDHLDVGRCFNLSFINRWKFIIIPATLPKIFDSIRLAFGLSWMAVVAAEMISAQNGLGHLISSAQDTLRSDLVIIGMLSIGAIGFSFDWLMKVLIRKFFPWKFS